MNCTRHPAEAVTGTCDRCGDFVCRLDSGAPASGGTLCAPCRERFGGEDWLRAFKMELWGKRDGYAWFFGAVGFLYSALIFVDQLADASRGLSAAAAGGLVASAGIGGVQLAYFLGRPWARRAIIVIPLIALAAQLVMMSNTTGDPTLAGLTLVSVVLPAVAYFDSRNKLFFKIDIPDEKLRKLWDLLRNNSIARTGLMCGILGLLVPGVGLIGLICSLVGLSRVDPSATPPIGKKGYAIAGILVSGLTTLFWGAVLVATALA